MARRTVGVIGGMGPAATVAFLEKLVGSTDAGTDREHLHVIVDCVPDIPDRSAFLMGKGPDPRPEMIRAAGRLKAAGADFLVIPCNTANAFARDVEVAVGLTVVRWLDLVVTSAQDRGIRALGVLATDGAKQAGIYDKALLEKGIQPVYPDDEHQHNIMEAIFGGEGAKAGRITTRTVDNVLSVAFHLADLGSESLLFGCTELPLIVQADDSRLPLPTIDPGTVVAAEVVRLAGGTVREGRAT